MIEAKIMVIAQDKSCLREEGKVYFENRLKQKEIFGFSRKTLSFLKGGN